MESLKSSDAKYNITLPEGSGVTEVIIREGDAPALPDLREPEKVKISGTLAAPFEWLRQRIGTIDAKTANIIVDRETMTICLTVNETSFFKTEITGRLELHPKFRELGINSDKTWEPNALGQFFKMNRAFFPDRTKNAEIVAQLKNFNARINATVDRVKNDNGSFADNFSAVVESNLPGTFSVSVPVFKGTGKEPMDVEIYTSIDGRNVRLMLVSPGACELVEEYRDKCIDDLLKKIAEVSGEIVIIEK
jgi:hypothetical protein